MNKELLEKLLISFLDQKSDNKNEESKETSPFIGEYVIVRGYYSGVHFGKLVHLEPGNCILENARRVWYWKAKKGLSLSEVAEYGITDGSKICKELKKIQITDSNISEILLCTEDSIKSFNDMKDYIV